VKGFQYGPDLILSGRHRSGLAWALLPHLAFVLMTIMTWKRWVLPFQDSGREMLTPARLAAGETLYRDVGSPYGPLPAYLDALVLRLLGKDLDVLIALRLTFALLGVEALRRLARRLVHEGRSASVITAFVVVSCLFGNGGNWPFPYSVAALEGTVGCWWALELALSSGGWGQSLLAALVAGLAAGTKLEMLPAAIVAISPALLILRPRREALVASGLAVLLGAAAFAVPILAFGVAHMHRYGFLVAFPVPKPWQDMYRNAVLFAGTNPRAFFSGDWLRIWLPSIAFFGAAVVLCSAPIHALLRAAALAALAALALPTIRDKSDIAALVPLAAVLFAVEAVGLWRERSSPDATRVARFCIAIAALPALARQPFFLRNMIYGAFSAPLALAVSLAFLARLVRFRGSFVLILAGLAGAHAFTKWQNNRIHAVEWVEVPRARLYLPAGEARLVRLAVDLIRRETAPDAYVVAFPDPGLLLFSTDRRSPFIDDVFYPGLQDAPGEDLMIRRLHERPVPLILVTNRNFIEYGTDRYGGGFLGRFFAELSRVYEPVQVLGSEPTETWSERHATMALVLRPRSGHGPAP
jgi:hypothetical protein